jgi:hypothetical protein
MTPAKECKMSLLDRYLHEVGRYLPRKNKSDIQAELRSSLVDSMEDRYGSEPSEAEVEVILKEFGSPREVAASYHPQGQYLVGPTLFPVFKMVAMIVIAAVLGAQALAWGISLFVGDGGFPILEMLASMFNSIPAALGWVVLVFMILQYFDAKPELDDEPWEPQTLPEINPDEDVKRGELIVGLVFSVLLLVLISVFPQWVGFVTFPGGTFYPNPVILRYLPMIQISLAAWIGMNTYLLWKRRQDLITRLLTFALNIYGVVLLSLLVAGHNTWLGDRSAGSFLEAIEAIPAMVDGGGQLVGMQAFRLAFVVALIVTVIEVITSFYRLVRSSLKKDFQPQT